MPKSHWRGLVVLCAVVATMVAPSSASASLDGGRGCDRLDSLAHDCEVSVESLATYKGWGHTRTGSCGGPVRIQPPHAAWRWAGYSWKATSLPSGQRVYIWPFAVGWSWVWTQSTGWLAMEDAQLVINPWCNPMLR